MSHCIIAVVGKNGCMHILIVDDHDLYRKGLAQAMQEFDHDIIISESDSVASASTCLRQHHQSFDLVLLDHDLPDGNGLTLLQDIQQHYPLLPVAILSAHEEHGLIKQVFSAGALGYIPKSTSTPILLKAIDLIQSGGTYIPPGLLPHMLEEKENETENKTDSISHPPNERSEENQLTQRQIEVLKLIRNGLSNKEIANTLHISVATVKAHITTILKVHGVLTRTRLMLSSQHQEKF